jgi:hypothetical protein
MTTVLCADEKTSVQARCRCHPTLAPGKARVMRVEHEYQRGGALAYLAAWDVHRGKVFGLEIHQQRPQRAPRPHRRSRTGRAAGTRCVTPTNLTPSITKAVIVAGQLGSRGVAASRWTSSSSRSAVGYSAPASKFWRTSDAWSPSATASRESRPLIDPDALADRNTAVVGFWLRPALTVPGTYAEPLTEMFALIAAGVLKPLTDAAYPLEDARRAFEDLLARRTTGKVTLRP